MNAMIDSRTILTTSDRMSTHIRQAAIVRPDAIHCRHRPSQHLRPTATLALARSVDGTNRNPIY
jgi:hypothetical protein